jgi:Flp pilus assembly CpaF family ATPase
MTRIGFEPILSFLRPIQHLILDADIGEIMVNGRDRIFMEKAGNILQGSIVERIAIDL